VAYRAAHGECGSDEIAGLHRRWALVTSLLDNAELSPARAVAVACNPYVDALSEIQLRLLRELRARPADDPDGPRLRRLVQLTLNGIAAGLQGTG
jgi:phosphoenolpyruvate carboxylase